MLSGKFLFTLIGLIISVFAICKMNFGQDTVEGWWGASPIQRRWKTFPVIKQGKGCGTANFTAAGGNFLGPLGDDRFIKRPQFQALMSPRNTGGADYGAHIRYNMPSYEHQGVPCEPLAFGDMAQEGYKPPASSVEGFQERYPTSCGSGSCGGGCSPSCGKGGCSVPYSGGTPATKPGWTSPSYAKQLDKAYSGSNYPDASSMMPVGTMTTVDHEGNTVEPVVFNNFVFANMRSRLRGLGDPIRGDLPIVPCEGNWFSVHPNVNLDLQEGALNVLGGVTNSQGQALTQLIHDASGNADMTIGGVNLADVNMTPQYTGMYSGINTDVTISGMP
jgi:hypothetical protein